MNRYREITLENVDKLPLTDRTIIKCYHELFMNSTPSISFYKLLNESPMWNEQIQIPFKDYEIEEEKLDSIIEKYSKKLRKLDRIPFKNTIMLGCSPKTKSKNA